MAARANIDAAMVHRHFGTKQQLLLAAIGLPRDLTDVLAGTLPGDVAGVGERVVRGFVELWDTAPLHSASFHGMLRLATSSPASASALRDYLTGTIGVALARTLDEHIPEQRVGLVGSQLLGIAVARYLFRLEPLASATPQEIAVELGWIVQQLLVGKGENKSANLTLA